MSWSSPTTTPTTATSAPASTTPTGTLERTPSAMRRRCGASCAPPVPENGVHRGGLPGVHNAMRLAKVSWGGTAMVRRGLFFLGVASLLIVPLEATMVRPAGAAADACKTRCLWDQPRFNGTMVELTDTTCKDFAVKS